MENPEIKILAIDRSEFDEMMTTIKKVEGYLRILTERDKGGQSLNSRDAAAYLGYSKSHLINHLKKDIGYSKDKGLITFKIADLDNWVEKNKQGGI